MRVFNPANFNQEAPLFVRDWIKLLSEDKFYEACSQLDAPLESDKNILWKVDNLKEVFLYYNCHKRMPEMTNPYSLNLKKERIYFYKYKDATGYAIEYDIPIDNEWGDLTAQFSFVKSTENLYYVFLRGYLKLSA